MTNTRWRRVKRGKFGRVSFLHKNKKWTGGWTVEYLYLDGVHKEGGYWRLRDALESQRRFLKGERVGTYL
jgi:hypothetical protein